MIEDLPRLMSTDQTQEIPNLGALDYSDGVLLNLVGEANHFEDVDLFRAGAAKRFGEHLAAHEPALLAVEGDVAEILSGTDNLGCRQEHGHSAGVVICTRCARDRIVVSPDQDSGLQRVSRNDITHPVHRDGGPTAQTIREKVHDHRADGVILGGTIDSGHGNLSHPISEIILGNGVEQTPVRFRQGRRTGCCDNESQNVNLLKLAVELVVNAPSA